MTIRHYNQSTWLAHRAIEAQALPVPAPEHVVLPGALRAIAHDRLLAYHDQGHAQQEIVDRTNATWRAENAGLLAEHDRWTQGPYTAAIRAAREAAMQAAAEELRRRALFEQKMAEWSAGA